MMIGFSLFLEFTLLFFSSFSLWFYSLFLLVFFLSFWLLFFHGYCFMKLIAETRHIDRGGGYTSGL